MKTLLRQNGFSETVAIIFIAGIIGTIFITYTFIWQESLKVKEMYNLKIAMFSTTVMEPETLEIPKPTELDSGYFDYQLADHNCTPDKCLFTTHDEVAGLGTLEGYYIKYLDTAFDEQEYCTSLVVTAGSQELIDSVLAWVDKGNTIYDKNELNQPIINFSLNGLSQADKDKFLNSTLDNPIELTVLRAYQEGAGRAVGTCWSHLSILLVK